ncbi:MAG: exodeoxyribonuclease VII small subunit [Bacteroidota bacterium]
MAKEKISYEASIKEIEEILEKIENGNLDVDELAGKVKRVTELLKICRDRLHKTEAQIDKILDSSDEQV